MGLQKKESRSKMKDSSNAKHSTIKERAVDVEDQKSGKVTPTNSTKKRIVMTNQSYIQIGNDDISPESEQHKSGGANWEDIGRASEKLSLSSASKRRRIEQKRNFFNYLGLGTINEKKKK